MFIYFRHHLKTSERSFFFSRGGVNVLKRDFCLPLISDSDSESKRLILLCLDLCINIQQL